jgi:hypothetical protein
MVTDLEQAARDCAIAQRELSEKQTAAAGCLVAGSLLLLCAHGDVSTIYAGGASIFVSALYHFLFVRVARIRLREALDGYAELLRGSGHREADHG